MMLRYFQVHKDRDPFAMSVKTTALVYASGFLVVLFGGLALKGPITEHLASQDSSYVDSPRAPRQPQQDTDLTEDRVRTVVKEEVRGLQGEMENVQAELKVLIEQTAKSAHPPVHTSSAPAGKVPSPR